MGVRTLKFSILEVSWNRWGMPFLHFIKPHPRPNPYSINSVYDPASGFGGFFLRPSKTDMLEQGQREFTKKKKRKKRAKAFRSKPIIWQELLTRVLVKGKLRKFSSLTFHCLRNMRNSCGSPSVASIKWITLLATLLQQASVLGLVRSDLWAAQMASVN